jgi:short-subunit dehydrogenase
MKSDFFTNKTIWVIGANSDIIKPLLLWIARDRGVLKLFSRNTTTLHNFLSEHKITAEYNSLDVSDSVQLEQLTASSSMPDGIIIAAGVTPACNCAENAAVIKQTVESNFLGCVTLLERIKKNFKAKRSGFICVISSVGGERGKASNSIYASTKAGLTCYMEGLCQELTPYGIAVTTIKPAWVKTKMTADMPKVQNSFVSQTAEQVAKKIYQAIIKRKNGSCYTGLRAWSIALIIKLIPDYIYYRLQL